MDEFSARIDRVKHELEAWESKVAALETQRGDAQQFEFTRNAYGAWTTTTYSNVGFDAPPEGLSADHLALWTPVYQRIKALESRISADQDAAYPAGVKPGPQASPIERIIAASGKAAGEAGAPVVAGSLVVVGAILLGLYFYGRK